MLELQIPQRGSCRVSGKGRVSRADCIIFFSSIVSPIIDDSTNTFKLMHKAAFKLKENVVKYNR